MNSSVTAVRLTKIFRDREKLIFRETLVNFCLKNQIYISIAELTAIFTRGSTRNLIYFVTSESSLIQIRQLHQGCRQLFRMPAQAKLKPLHIL